MMYDLYKITKEIKSLIIIITGGINFESAQRFNFFYKRT